MISISPLLNPDFNPRSPCGERHERAGIFAFFIQFQSTLPVWGATGAEVYRFGARGDFNPRSPCGERLHDIQAMPTLTQISIHAPRVGSDEGFGGFSTFFLLISIHAPRVGSVD